MESVQLYRIGRLCMARRMAGSACGSMRRAAVRERVECVEMRER